MTAREYGRGRYAPSPSGPLHLGNLRTALLAWLFARHAGASFVLRIEDLDRRRVRSGAAAHALEDLRWLGLDWDEGPDLGGPLAPYTQSERLALYREVLAGLEARGVLYPCYCSRSDIGQAASAPHGPASHAARYPGTCRNPELRERKKAAAHGRPPSLRFRTTNETIVFTDSLCGRIEEDVADAVGDFVVWRSDGTPAYQFAVVVDDSSMGIDEVVRGSDLLASTARQITLYRALGRAAPRFAHVPLLRDAEGARMAKRSQSEGLAPLRSAGRQPEEVIGMLAASCGLLPERTPIAARALLKIFQPERIARDQPDIVPAIGDRLLWQVRTLLRAYAGSLGIDLSVQGFDREIDRLPGEYAPPGGRLLVASLHGRVLGCVALRALDDGVCEMKRLYVTPAARGSGLGRRLLEAILHEACAAGYNTIRLDTLPSMASAQSLYRSCGFHEIPPYRANPVAGAVFMEAQLQ